MKFEESMHEVLESPRYDFLMERRVDIREIFYDLMEKFFMWLFDNFGLEIPEPTGGSKELIAVIFTIVAIILVSTAAFVLIRAYLRTRRPKRHSLETLFEELRNHTVAELLEISRNAQTRRIAVRYKYIAVLLWLNENDIIVIEPSATNAIILRQIRNSAPQLAAPFFKITDAFHLTWFGHKELSDENFLQFESSVSEVISHE